MYENIITQGIQTIIVEYIMGDMTDYYLAHSDWCAEEFYEYEPEDGLNTPATFSCRYCKKGRFLWVHTDKGWRLGTTYLDKHGQLQWNIHSCGKHKQEVV